MRTFSICILALLLEAAVFASSSDHPAKGDPRVSSTVGGHPPQPPGDCPSACPCCAGCDPISGCRKSFLPHGDTYLKLRKIIGCDTLPVGTTTLCTINKCEPDCLCREKVLNGIQQLLFEGGGGGGHDGNGSKASPSPALNDTTALRPWKGPSKPFYCPKTCPCCDGCRHLPSCDKKLLPDNDRFLDLRNSVGCDTLPITTELCPVDACHSECLCRGEVLKEAKKALFGTMGDNNFESDEAPQRVEL